VLVDEYWHGKYDKAEISNAKVKDKKIVNGPFVFLASDHGNYQTVADKTDDKCNDVEA